jgi:hypothetical protein
MCPTPPCQSSITILRLTPLHIIIGVVSVVSLYNCVYNCVYYCVYNCVYYCMCIYMLPRNGRDVVVLVRNEADDVALLHTMRCVAASLIGTEIPSFEVV